MASIFDAFNPAPPSAYQATGGYNSAPPNYLTSSTPQQSAQTGSGNVSAPSGAQDQYDAYLGGKSAKPLLNSATGQPLDKTGQVDESQVDTRSIWSRMGLGGRLGKGLETGSLLASMIPGGRTIGENISQVSGALTNLPYAELMHQYQLSEPGLQRMKEMLGLQQTQAETGLKQAQAGYYDTRNQASILAQQLRGASAEQLRAQAGKPIPRWDMATEDGVGPNGVPFKKGQRVWGYDVPQYAGGNPNDPTDPGSLTHVFQPQSTEDEDMKARWGMGGGGSYQQHYINEYVQQFPRGKKGDLTNPIDVQTEALDDYKLHNQTMPGIAILQGGAGVPQRPQNPQVDRSKADQDEYKSILLPEKTPKASEVAAMSPEDRQAYGLDPQPLGPNFMQEPGKVADFAKSHNQKIAQFKSQYERLPQDQQTGFQNYLVDQGYNPRTKQFAPQAKPAAGQHVIQYGTWKYRYSGQGDTADIKNYTPLTKEEMEAK